MSSYLLPLLGVNGDITTRSLSIHCWRLMISVKRWLQRVSNVSIGLSLLGGVPWVFVDLILFLICFMWPFVISMEGVRCFMSSTVRLVQVVKGCHGVKFSLL